MKTRIATLLLLALGLSTGCKNSTTIENNPLGTFRGNVFLITPSGDTISNRSGAVVSVEGTAFSTTTSSSGDWQINNVPAGIYNLVITKVGFDTLIIPQYEFSGAGTSFVMNNAIQAYPQDSVVFSIVNKTADSSATRYLGEMVLVGGVVGPDSLDAGRFDITYGDTSATDRINMYLVKNQVPIGEIRSYEEPPFKSGTLVTIRSYVFGNMPKTLQSYSHFAQAMSPYVTVRSFRMP